MKSSIKPTIHFLPDARSVSIESEQESILALAQRHNIAIGQTCGGNATCGTCLVRVEEGAENLCLRNEWEQEMAEDRGYLFNERLACQTQCRGPVTVRILIKG